MRQKYYRAGLLPFIVEDGLVKFLLMKPADPRYGGDKFQIAKGKIESGETPLQGALREAEEELGLIVTNIKEPTFLGDFLGRTSIYFAEVIDPKLFKAPHFETSETKWMTAQEFSIHGRPLHRNIIKLAESAILFNFKIGK